MQSREERIIDESNKRGGYFITLLCLFLFAILVGALAWSMPPVSGRFELASSAEREPWTIGYVGDEGPTYTDTLARQMGQNKNVLFFVGPAVLAAKAERTGAVPAPRSFFPVWDGSATDANMGVRFSHIPEEQLAGYGRTAYFVDYGEARFWFLNAERLATEPAVQLAWLKRTAEQNPQLHRIVFLNKEPMQAEVWAGLADSGVELVLVGALAYAPEAAVTERPKAGYSSSAAHPGWAAWTLSGPAASGLLKVEGNGSRLEATAASTPGRAADRLALDAAGLRQPAAVQERSALSIGAMWRYRAGGADLPAVIPQGLDLTGEQPLTSQVALPREDWRSPAFADAQWGWAAAPFGRSRESIPRSGIATLLPATPESPAYYFRKTFVVDEDPAAMKEWLLQVAFEDGFIAYLNGIEIARDSIREGLVDFRSVGIPHKGGLFETYPLTNQRNVVVRGVNTLAIEVHGSHPQTPELWFDASLSYKK
ncbi:hypothetical protein G9U52_29805 [Paenibacillus sp. S3N08]|uniref:Uncharacterized protein n=1 Tax=Paenibacillus agricola TaxID=2716264 RepID=A0ABX0JJM4_9BACL|nr:hypothetical protein [Paenibacillus agricola]